MEQRHSISNHRQPHFDGKTLYFVVIDHVVVCPKPLHRVTSRHEKTRYWAGDTNSGKGTHCRGLFGLGGRCNRQNAVPNQANLANRFSLSTSNLNISEKSSAVISSPLVKHITRRDCMPEP